MGWKGALRSGIALSRRIERESRRQQRELERRQKELHKLAEAERSALEVETYENHVERLTSVHRECSERIDWASLRHPGVDRSESLRIRHQLESYRAGFFGRLTGSAARGRQQLENQLHRALTMEAQAESEATERARLAEGILRGDEDAWNAAVDWSGCLVELTEMGLQPEGHFPHHGRAEVRLLVGGFDAVVPAQQLSLTQTHKVSRRKMTKARGKEIYLEFVAGSAVRAARELYAVLPLQGVLVHVDSALVNEATGHFERHCILTAYVPLEALGANFVMVSAPSFVTQLKHRMKWTKGALHPVEPLAWTELELRS